MATVYRAHQLSMDRDVAIKALPSHYLNQLTSLERFKQEASIVARLEHRAIVPVHDFGEYQGIPYLVMRFMEGGALEDLLANGPIDPERTARIARQIAPALDYAHRQGVLHRDLKPSNILLDANGDAYLTDFGIARILGQQTKPLTTSGVVGTPSYMSPEQAQGHDLDGRSDVYALGVVLFEMLTGVRPFEGETPYTVAVKHVTEAPPSPCTINPRLSRTVENVLFKALEKNRENRYQTAGELVEALKQAIASGTAPGSEVSNLAETEPSLTEKLRLGEARRRLDTSRVFLRRPDHLPDGAVSPPLPERGRPQQPSPASQLYHAPHAASSQRRRLRSRGSWLMWFTVALIIVSLLLAVAAGGIYYVLNNASSPAGTRQDWNATAIFKMTVTKDAILGGEVTPTPDIEASRLPLNLSATPLPTNTPRSTAPNSDASEQQ